MLIAIVIAPARCLASTALTLAPLSNLFIQCDNPRSDGANNETISFCLVCEQDSQAG